VWAFSEFLPASRQVSLGEGFTPEVDAPQWDATFKLDYILPSASFKDRGTTVMLSRAADLDVETVVDDSSGNAGSSVALYAARAGMDAEIFTPASAPEGKLKAIGGVGATTTPIEGRRSDVTDACVAKVERGDAWYASHCWRPSFLAGEKTYAFEVALRRGWESPDAVILPMGVGTMFLGAYRGFRDLVVCGWIDEIPRMLGAQAAGFAPVADALHDRIPGENVAADGLHSGHSPREDELFEAIETTDGDAVAVSEEQTMAVCAELGRAGFYVEPTSAVPAAALEIYQERGVLDEFDDVVVGLCGSGLNA
jgi:threonine synthase